VSVSVDLYRSLIEEFRGHLEARYAVGLKALNSPADDRILDAAADALGIELPYPLRVLYRVANGQYNFSAFSLVDLRDLDTLRLVNSRMPPSARRRW
jgi:cell wall assembly regulator SMI1